MFNDCLPKFITPKLRFYPVCSQWNQWAREREIVVHTIRRRVTQRQRLSTELNVKVKGGKFLKTTMVLLQWRV